MRLQPPSGLAGAPQVSSLTCSCSRLLVAQKEAREKERGKKRFKNGKAEGVLPGGPSNESTQLPSERFNPFFLGTRS